MWCDIMNVRECEARKRAESKTATKSKEEKAWKNLKKGIDKADEIWYNTSPLRKYSESEKSSKKTQKTFEKGIDKAKQLWYTV